MIKKSRRSFGDAVDFHKGLMEYVLPVSDASSVIVPHSLPASSSPSPMQILVPMAIDESDKLTNQYIGFHEDKLQKNWAYNLENENALHKAVVKHVQCAYPDLKMVDCGQDLKFQFKVGKCEFTVNRINERMELGYLKGTCDLMIFGNHPKIKALGIEFQTLVVIIDCHRQLSLGSILTYHILIQKSLDPRGGWQAGIADWISRGSPIFPNNIQA